MKKVEPSEKRLYHTIAEYYDEIFPLKEIRKKFICSLLPDKSLSILDIGCATGELAMALSEMGHQVTGIDLDSSMIQRAREKIKQKKLKVKFLQKDMLNIAEDFPQHSFDSVICLGNTLVHLRDLKEIDVFLKGVKKLLRNEGLFFLQIVNYHRFLSEKIKDLPLIEVTNYTFQRKYQFDVDEHRILFHTRLIPKNKGAMVNNSHYLYPLTFLQLKSGLSTAGFTHTQFFGDENQAPFNPHKSPALISVSQ